MGLLDKDYKKWKEGFKSGDALTRAAVGPSSKQYKAGLRPGLSAISFLRGDISHDKLLKEYGEGGEDFIKIAGNEAFQAGTAAPFGALGHLFKRNDKPDADGVPDAPSQGAGVLQARQDARRRAIEAARQRYGLASTITTTPLGLQGAGAQTGQRRLLGS